MTTSDAATASVSHLHCVNASEDIDSLTNIIFAASEGRDAMQSIPVDEKNVSLPARDVDDLFMIDADGLQRACSDDAITGFDLDDLLSVADSMKIPTAAAMTPPSASSPTAAEAHSPTNERFAAAKKLYRRLSLISTPNSAISSPRFHARTGRKSVPNLRHRASAVDVRSCVPLPIDTLRDIDDIMSHAASSEAHVISPLALRAQSPDIGSIIELSPGASSNGGGGGVPPLRWVSRENGGPGRIASIVDLADHAEGYASPLPSVYYPWTQEGMVPTDFSFFLDHDSSHEGCDHSGGSDNHHYHHCDRDATARTSAEVQVGPDFDEMTEAVSRVVSMDDLAAASPLANEFEGGLDKAVGEKSSAQSPVIVDSLPNSWDPISPTDQHEPHHPSTKISSAIIRSIASLHNLTRSSPSLLTQQQQPMATTSQQIANHRVQPRRTKSSMALAALSAGQKNIEPQRPRSMIFSKKAPGGGGGGVGFEPPAPPPPPPPPQEIGTAVSSEVDIDSLLHLGAVARDRAQKVVEDVDLVVKDVSEVVEYGESRPDIWMSNPTLVDTAAIAAASRSAPRCVDDREDPDGVVMDEVARKEKPSGTTATTVRIESAPPPPSATVPAAASDGGKQKQRRSRPISLSLGALPLSSRTGGGGGGFSARFLSVDEIVMKKWKLGGSRWRSENDVIATKVEILPVTAEAASVDIDSVVGMAASA